MNDKMKARLKLFLKVAFVFALLYFLGKKGFLSLEQTRRAILMWPDSLPGLAILCFASLLGVLRWQWLLEAHGIRLPLSRTFQLTYIGNFFNIALPGAVSGDFVKAFYVGKEAHGQKTKAFGSILFDRVAGLSALALLSAGAFLIQAFQSHGSQGTSLRAIQFFVTTSAVLVIVFYAYLFLVREKHDPLFRLFKGVEKKVPKLGLFAQVYESLRHYHNHRLVVVKSILISLVVHLLVGWAILHFAAALGETRIPVLSLYVVFPIGLLITAIPVLPAGVGTGHAAFLYLFGLLGSQRGADVFSLYALSQILISCVGGIIYLRFRSTGHALARDSLHQPA